jgi:hypothetical protein
MRINGRCHCGKITFEAEVEAGTARLCHCSDCQTMTGSAFRANIQAPAASFVLRGDQPTIYVKTADSGNRRAHAFCATCGTPIYSAAIENPTTYSLRVGTIAQRKELGPPVIQVWCQSALPWSGNLGGIAGLPRQ